MTLIKLVRDAALYWNRNDASRHAAALTYYALASMASLILLLLAAASAFFNPERVSRFLVSPVAAAIGPDNSQFIQSLVQSYYDPEASVTLGAFSLLIILNTGSNLFIQLGASLNEFLNIPGRTEELPPVRQVLRALLGRLRAFAYVLGAELLILVGLFASTGLQIAQSWIEPYVQVPLGIYAWVSRLVSMGIAVLMLALIYRLMPRERMPWRAVMSGALIAGLLFIVLQELMRLYLASAGIGSAFGAAGSVVVFLFWVYYSVQALFFGAAAARVLARQAEE